MVPCCESQQLDRVAIPSGPATDDRASAGFPYLPDREQWSNSSTSVRVGVLSFESSVPFRLWKTDCRQTSLVGWPAGRYSSLSSLRWGEVGVTNLFFILLKLFVLVLPWDVC